MIYMILAINILWLVAISTFIGYSVAKGQIIISPRQVLDKETSMELAKEMKEEMKNAPFGGEY